MRNFWSRSILGVLCAAALLGSCSGESAPQSNAKPGAATSGAARHAAGKPVAPASAADVGYSVWVYRGTADLDHGGFRFEGVAMVNDTCYRLNLHGDLPAHCVVPKGSEVIRDAALVRLFKRELTLDRLVALKRTRNTADACRGFGEGEILVQLVAGIGSVMGPPPEVHTFIFPSLYDCDPDSPYGPITTVLSYVR